MKPVILSLTMTALMLNAAVFGFFYAWICSTMWGLDAADPRNALAAMQAMNASVRNAVFFPSFFLTPVALGAVAALLLPTQRAPAMCFGAAAVIYLCGGLVLTMTVNVPMNEALARIAVPDSIEEAGRIWNAYSAPWQRWNIVRTVASGLALLIALWGTLLMDRNAL
ncbi:DUF1772 domain-containing protein [Paracoccus sediminicola]|uniref:anthrone oxygenase family protein n=1 Tax=Paracoccus sediminicola TaxID=3017783 RepID=UPI0022F0EC0F|nr:anthrone oxygenase family protein [Paracoccus sediminicola]WBU57928.1 DUF1772 domain-containing protein [Paracoccus sediminicola]